MFRVFRVFKIGRYSRSVRLMGLVLKKKSPDLVVILMSLSVLLVIAATFMYYAEHEAQPKVFSSIPASLWWGITTLTTVGYGDAFPITPLGKLVGGAIAVLGIGLFALPAGILAAGFSSEVERLQTGGKDEASA
ncbi:MAG: ion transporter [Phycisphaeraceae bacterium]